jgi:transketolase
MTDMDKAIEEARAAIMPFESWERLPGESALAYAAFRAFRDYGPERNVRKAVETAEKDKSQQDRKYRTWRNWCSQFRWRERAADYDRYMEKLKQAELRKTIEAQGEQHRAVTRKMLEKVEKKLDLMDPADLTQNTVTEWVETAIRADRDGAGLTVPNGKSEPKQGEINFTPEFNGL